MYVVASGIGSFGLGVAAFYLNFVYRALGLGELAIGSLAAAQAVGGVAGAWPAARLARTRSRRAAILAGGVVTAAGLAGVLVFDRLPLLVGAAVLLGAGGIVVFSSGSALLADASAGADRPRVFGQQVAVATIAAFLSAWVAGQMADPIAARLGAAPGSLLVVRALVAVGGVLAGASAVPILFVGAVAVPRGAPGGPARRGLLLRFAAVEALIGFGAGSFIPFINLFLADRFALGFGGIGLALGAIAVGGSVGAVLHGIHVAPRLGELRGVVLVQLSSVPFALVAGVVPVAAVAVGALAVRAGLMYGSSSTWRAFELASFRPAERAGVSALVAIAWGGTFALGSVAAGAVRAALGDAGWTVNVATLGVAYVAAAAVAAALLGEHEPAGDVAPDVALPAAPHSPA